VFSRFSGTYVLEFDISKGDYQAWLARWNMAAQPIEGSMFIESAARTTSVNTVVRVSIEKGVYCRGPTGRNLDQIATAYDEESGKGYLVVTRDP